MKILTSTAMLILWSVTASAVNFDPTQTTVDPSGSSVRVNDLNSTPVGLGLQLPVDTRYIELAPGQSLSDLIFTTGSAQLIGQTDPSRLYDLPTAADPDQLPTDLNPPTAGRTPAVAPFTVTRNGTRYARADLYPVTVDTAGRLWLHSDITVSIDKNPIPDSRLLLPAQLPKPDRRSSHALTAGSPHPNYIIITAEPLAEQAAALSAYRTAVGYDASVKLIENIVPAYSGADDAAKLREYLKDFHANGGRYVLLVGDESVLPIRYAYDLYTSSTVEPDRLQICDLYFSDLTGDWDVDHDGVYGEWFEDAADFEPELRLGRLPFDSPEQLATYIKKLIRYETLDIADPAYLQRAFFFSSDEMRDYGAHGQHALIADAYPDHFTIDTTGGVELAAGDDPSPCNAPASEALDTLGNGYGIINIIAHGRPDGFATRTSGYNHWPKSYIITEDPLPLNATPDSLTPNGKVGLYYSLACDHGGFDKDSPPFIYTNPNLVTTLLAQPDAGAVAFVAYSRWGWVGASHVLQREFFAQLFAHPDRPAIDAMNTSKLTSNAYRDMIYGQNFYGDPALRIHTAIPARLTISLDLDSGGLRVTVTNDATPIPACTVLVSTDSGRVASAVTGTDGSVVIVYDFPLGRQHTIAARHNNCAVGLTTFTPNLATDIDNDTDPLPASLPLFQNYPNPFNPSTTIDFTLPTAARTDLTIYDITGRRVRTLLDRTLSAGSHSVVWDGSDHSGSPAASGVYFYRLSTADFTRTRKMVLVR